jgi:hypothetical protein
MFKLTICFTCIVGVPAEVFTQYDHIQVKLYITYLKIGTNENGGGWEGGYCWRCFPIEVIDALL